MASNKNNKLVTNFPTGEVYAKKIANAWRNHRKTREGEGKILSASSRDKISKTGRGFLLWDILKEQKEHLRRKEMLKEPLSTNQKLELALSMVEGIAKGASSVNNHLWLVMDTEHWLEFCDELHRYGANLKIYYDYWLESQPPQDFFKWLDEEDKDSGKKVELPARPREILESQRVRYLNKTDRKAHEVIFKGGLLIYSQSGEPVHTNPTVQTSGDSDPTVQEMVADTKTFLSISDINVTNSGSFRSLSNSPGSVNLVLEENEEQNQNTSSSKPPARRDSADAGIVREKWIYVTDCEGNFYVGKKVKGHFHHSSFLAGGAIRAAGGIKVRDGKLLEINPNSGHYKPAKAHFNALVEKLINEGINIKEVKVTYPNESLEKRIMAKYIKSNVLPC